MTLESILDENEPLKRDTWFKGRILDLLNMYHDCRVYERDLINLSREVGLKVHEVRAYVSVYSKFYDKSKGSFINDLTLHIK